MDNKKTFKQRIPFLILGASILAFGMFNIHSRCAITEGGILGLTLFINHWFGITPGITGLILDSCCYFLGFKILGKEFLKNAIVASCSFSVAYNTFEFLGPMLPDLSGNPLLAAVAGGLFVGVGVAIVVINGGASGGDDALALIIAKYTGLKLARAYLFTDLTVLALSLSYIPFRRIAYSLVTVTISSYSIDFIQSFVAYIREKKYLIEAEPETEAE